MNKIIYCIIFILLIFCHGCSLFVSDAKYNADAAMWQAKGEASKAWAIANTNNKIATMTAKSGEVFTVYNHSQVAPMPVVAEPNAFVQTTDTILNSAAIKIFGGGWAIGHVLDRIGTTSYNSGDNSPITVKKDSENSINVTTKHVEGDGSVTEHSNSDNADTATTSTATTSTATTSTDSRTNYDNTTTDGRTNYDNTTTTTDGRTNYDNTTTTDSTSPPTIVVQPEPVIVK